jgi:hypothetical protein
MQALRRNEAALQQQLSQLQTVLQDKAQEQQQQIRAHAIEKQVGCCLPEQRSAAIAQSC